MRTMIHILYRSVKRPPWFAFLVMLIVSVSVYGQDQTARQSLSRQYRVTRESTLEVRNKYGRIDVITWDRDSVDLRVEIILTESSSSKLKKLKEDRAASAGRVGRPIPKADLPGQCV